MTAGEGRAAVFLDRDGVIVIPEFRDGRSFAPRRLEDLVFYPDAPDSLRRLKEAGYLTVVVTNQPDVGNGLVDASVLEAMHARMCAELPIDRVEVCPHGQSQGCACRKPQPGMLTSAAREMGISFARSFMLGDRASDIAAGHAVGCRTIFVDLDYDEPRPQNATLTVRSLREATDAILGHAI